MSTGGAQVLRQLAAAQDAGRDLVGRLGLVAPMPALVADASAEERSAAAAAHAEDVARALQARRCVLLFFFMPAHWAVSLLEQSRPV